MKSIPLCPASAAFQEDCVSLASGVTAPRPVITTRFTEASLLTAQQLEARELAPAEGGAAREAIGPARLQDVHEAGERPAIPQLAPDHAERDAEQRADPRLPRVAGDALAHPEERRQQPAGSPHVPRAVELAHRR